MSMECEYDCFLRLVNKCDFPDAIYKRITPRHHFWNTYIIYFCSIIFNSAEFLQGMLTSEDHRDMHRCTVVISPKAGGEK